MRLPRATSVLALALAGCGGPDDDFKPLEERPQATGAPVVGAAEGELRLPVGLPLSGYTARCQCLGGFSRQDQREGAYTTYFAPSVGVQTWPSIKVIWISNGEEDLVVTKTDSIYSYDGLVDGLERALTKAVGKDMRGKVVHTANHSHSSWGTFNHGLTWYLGSDRYNEEIFQRMVDQIAEVAVRAHDGAQPAKIGARWAVDWDPTDAVYHDRRSSNDTLQPWGEEGPPLGKDPHLGILRFDTLEDEPIAMMVNFGMHGIIGGEDNPLASADSGGHVEIALQETFDRPVVVMFAQGSGGDSSPGGRQDGFARMESVGEAAAGLIRPLYDEIVTSDAPISMETVTRSYTKHPSTIRVTRDGATDLRYRPYDEDPEYVADNVLYDEEGAIASPIDEFNVPNGAVFCGSGDLDIPIGNITGVEVFPYDQCIDVSLVTDLVKVWFDVEDQDATLPLRETLSAQTTLARLGPLQTRRADGTQVEQPLLVGFFPGEPVHSFGEQWRRRAEAELGFQDAMIVGYSQDHEGYLLIPEDWLTGGYEPDIGVWGPLEAEYVMERVLAESGPLARSSPREVVDPFGRYRRTVYPTEPLPTRQPDNTPDAGTPFGTAPFTEVPEYFWTPFVDLVDDYAPKAPTAAELTVPDVVPRVQGIVQLAWLGGDPMVDAPTVTLQRKDGADWVDVTTPSGRPVTDGATLLGHTPEPLNPVDAAQTHRWWAGWQAVGAWADRGALPFGTYRLHVDGQHRAGDAERWPWPTEPYAVDSDPFEVVRGALDVTLREDEDAGLDGISVSLRAPLQGWRMVHADGDYHGDNPVVGDLSLWVDVPLPADPRDPMPEDPDEIVPASLVTLDGQRSYATWRQPTTWSTLVVEDGAGNRGLLTYVPPYVPPPVP